MDRPGSLRMSVNLARWNHGMNKLELPHVEAAVVAQWDLAVEVFFSATQAAAHVLSGDMISTGRFNVERDGTDVVGTLEYGGIPGAATGEIVDYVKYELRRKGSHDFYGRGLRKSRQRLEHGVGDMLETAFKEAFGRP